MKASFALIALLWTAGATAAEPSQQPAGAATTGRTNERGAYRLDRLPILGIVLHRVYHQYVDPTRIDPRRMVVAALESVERTVAEVVVRGDAASPRLSLSVGSATQELDLSAVDTIWKARVMLGEAMGFVQEHLVAPRDLAEIEYAAANGLLSTLDSNSTLLEPRIFRALAPPSRTAAGLGVVLGIRDGSLTVVKIPRQAQANGVGLRPKDVISEIDGESTVDLDVQGAVDRTRGAPNSHVLLTVLRPGTPEPVRLDLTRRFVSVEAVARAQLLEGRVGYLKLTQLYGNTAQEVSKALRDLTDQAGGKLDGLALDLRGNQGGLLEQAVEVSDLFLSRGVILKAVGGGAKRIDEVRRATAQPTDLLDLPLVVVVDDGTASGGEIVASALKANGRALVVGRRTLGVNTIQSLFDFKEPDSGAEAALKMTIARFFTPGDSSVQEVGVTPDVALEPCRAERERVSCFAPARAPGEAGLHGRLVLSDLGKARRERASLELKYLLEQSEEEASDADADPFVPDYQIRFARELIARAPYPERARMLEAAKALVAQRGQEEAARLAKRLGELGVDWTAGSARGTPRAVVAIAPRGRDVQAGNTVQWTVTVENRGDGPFRRLRAWSRVQKNPLLDGREFTFGTIEPGQSRSWTVPVDVPRGSESRRDEVVLHFEDEGGQAPDDVVTAFGVVEAPRPQFAFSLEAERVAAKGGGAPPGDQLLEVRLDVRNVGPGASSERTHLSLSSLAGDGLSIRKGREVIGALHPGESRKAVLEAEVRQGAGRDPLPVRVRIVDATMTELLSARLDLPVAPGAPAARPPAARRQPPRIVLDLDPMKGAPVAETERLLLRGTASLPASAEGSRIRDLLVFVNDRKVLFKPGGEGASASALEFEASLPLDLGANFVTVLARVDDELLARRDFVVARRPPAAPEVPGKLPPGAEPRSDAP